MTLLSRLQEVIENSRHQLSEILPSDWAELNMSFTEGRFQGPLSFDITPYMREPLNCLSPYHPALEVVFKGAAQMGKSKTIIEPAICYYISEHPCNIGYLTGHSDLSEESMTDLDTAIYNARLQHLIMAKVPKKRNAKTGDTQKVKEYLDGKLVSGSVTNHKLLRQRNWRLVFVDDLDASKSSSKESGSTISLVRERTKSYGNKKKIFWVSTPEREETSLIEPLFASGDQRLWHWPCPCCGAQIALEWEIDIPGTNEKAGIYWKPDSMGRPIPGSVGYVCQECANFFDDRNKYELNQTGLWTPTAKAIDPNLVSFYLSGLYAPHGMDDWTEIANRYVEANPKGQPRNEALYKTWINLKIGKGYKTVNESPQANSIQRNCREYEVGTIPEKVSLNDGNGRIVMLTCAADMNGKLDDARLDWEIVAWSEGGQSYSVKQGSVGTFIPRENTKKEREDREHWTYEENKQYSVWPEFNKVLSEVYTTDTGRSMQVLITGLDCGHYHNYAYAFLDNTPNYVVGLKGDKEDKYVRFGIDVPTFKPARERSNLFILQVGLIKDDLSDFMQLRWNDNEPSQPSGFMNFPLPAAGLYSFSNYFSHFESEHRVLENNDDGQPAAARWVKKNSSVQNHFWDCRVYNLAVRDIIVSLIGKELKIKAFTWKDYVDTITAAASE